MTTTTNTGWKAYDVKVVKSEGEWVGSIRRVEGGQLLRAVVGTDKCDAHRKIDRELRKIRKQDKRGNRNTQPVVNELLNQDQKPADDLAWEKRQQNNKELQQAIKKGLDNATTEQTPDFVPVQKVTEVHETLPSDGDDWEGSLYDILDGCAVYNHKKVDDNGRALLKPVPTVKNFFEVSHHLCTRKLFIETCVEYGINKCTAATQYGHAKTAQNKAKEDK